MSADAQDMIETVEIARLGAKGDGIAERGEGEPVYVPFALPGERWSIARNGAAVRLTESPDRVAEKCRHFGTCGGCVAQHLSDDLYAAWKTASVREAFAHRGIDAEVLPVHRIGPGTRRRAILGIVRRGDKVGIGFREEGQHTLVDMAECPILDPLIVAALPALREMGRIAMPHDTPGRLIVTRVDAGLDVAYTNGLKMLKPDERAELARIASAARVTRLIVAGDPIVVRAEPSITIGGVAIDVPPQIFLQAVPEAEQMMIDFVVAALPKKAKKAADLFSGVGTFTLPLARHVAMTAYDSDRKAITALEAAHRRATGLKPVEARVRDLFREPLSPKELEAFDAVVLDPPRAGAAAQTERLARSKVPVVVAVSCAPATLARDARTLIDAGFKMGPVQPIDQFLWSPHVEAITVFRR
ncbi:MAG: class I SAM-dependent RNA methyltransferase [Hyphomicrobium sp.]|nr:class I SAM-dependent RNA methyltransferase [Hyphomicrobium sp.]